jgi:glycosyltransferase involved in cell wall biosynthesis
MRVLHVVKKLPPLVGGDATAVSALARSQRALGLDVQLATYNTDAQFDPEVKRVGPLLRRTDLDRIAWRRFRGMTALRKWALDYLAADRVDVVHAHAVDLAYAIAPAARKNRVRTVLTCHGVWFPQLPRWSPRGRIEWLLLRRTRADAVTSVDTASVAALRKLGLTRARLIPNGVDPDEFPEPPPRDGPVRFLFAGRHERQKGLDILLRGVAEARDLGAVGFVVDVVGEGTLTERLRSQARDLGIEGLVRFPGVLSRPDLCEVFVSSDVFVLPSRAEGLPIAILEAWAAHLAVIATRVGGVVDLCSEQNALLIPPEDPGALAQAILGMLRDPSWRGTLADNGRRLVRERFTWDAIAKSYVDVYGETR